MTRLNEISKVGSTPVRAATANRKFRFPNNFIDRRRRKNGASTNVAKFEQRIRGSSHAMIRVHDSAGNVMEAHKHAAERKGRTTALFAGLSRFWLK
jgi:hypothetical protein